MVRITLGGVNPVPGSSIRYKTGSWRAMRPVYTCDKCKKCRLCVIYCPDSAVQMGEDCAVVNYDYCKGCGICANECKFEAIEMVPEEK